MPYNPGVLLATPGNAYKRKNCRYVDGQTQPAGTCVANPSPGGFGLGIDLNRNYGALWGGPGTSDNPADPVYRGPAPFSEPETQAIRNLISTRQVTTVITNHTFSNLVLRPVGVQPSTIAPDGNPVGFAPDECFTGADGIDNGMQALGERMAAQNGYSNQFGWELYDTTGTTEDYSYNATGGYGYTFEIGTDEFHPPFEQVVGEYIGDTEAAQGVTPETAADLTTEAADECGGAHQEHGTVGGGNREAFLLAFENAVDRRHALAHRGSRPGRRHLEAGAHGRVPAVGRLAGRGHGRDGDDNRVDRRVQLPRQPLDAAVRAVAQGHGPRRAQGHALDQRHRGAARQLGHAVRGHRGSRRPHRHADAHRSDRRRHGPQHGPGAARPVGSGGRPHGRVRAGEQPDLDRPRRPGRAGRHVHAARGEHRRCRARLHARGRHRGRPAREHTPAVRAVDAHLHHGGRHRRPAGVSASSAARGSMSATSAMPASGRSTQASARKFTPEFLAEAATSPVVVTRCRQPGARPS